MKFYPNDWVVDTRVLTLEQRGGWIDILCALWQSETRGIKTMSWEDWGQILSLDTAQTELLVLELKRKKIANATVRYGKVTIENRRMVREEHTRTSSKNRMKRFRSQNDATSYANVTPEKSEVRSQKSDNTPLTPLPGDNKKFSIPTPEEVEAYAKSIAFFSLRGRAFCAFYESKGWKVGSSPMKSWKAAVVTWKEKEAANSARPSPYKDSDDLKKRWKAQGLSSCHGVEIITTESDGKRRCNSCLSENP